MSAYAVSDIHGCYDELMLLLEEVEFGAEDRLYILGDMIDRGPQSHLLVQWLVSAGDNVFYQWGNHEQMMSWSLEGDWKDLRLDGESSELWMRHGGEQTYNQFKKLSPGILESYQELLKASPKVRVAYSDDQMVLLAHAGIRLPKYRGKPYKLEDISEQAEDDLLWITWDWIASEGKLPCEVVFGHMPTTVIFSNGRDIPGCPRDQFLFGAVNQIMQWNGRHAIDCSCVHGGNLALLRLDDWEGFYQPCLFDGGYWR